MLCKSCGKPIDLDSVFCKYCGQKIENVSKLSFLELNKNNRKNNPISIKTFFDYFFDFYNKYEGMEPWEAEACSLIKKYVADNDFLETAVESTYFDGCFGVIEVVLEEICNSLDNDKWEFEEDSEEYEKYDDAIYFASSKYNVNLMGVFFNTYCEENHILYEKYDWYFICSMCGKLNQAYWQTFNGTYKDYIEASKKYICNRCHYWEVVCTKLKEYRKDEAWNTSVMEFLDKYLSRETEEMEPWTFFEILKQNGVEVTSAIKTQWNQIYKETEDDISGMYEYEEPKEYKMSTEDIDWDYPDLY